MTSRLNARGPRPRATAKVSWGSEDVPLPFIFGGESETKRGRKRRSSLEYNPQKRRRASSYTFSYVVNAPAKPVRLSVKGYCRLKLRVRSFVVGAQEECSISGGLAGSGWSGVPRATMLDAALVPLVQDHKFLREVDSGLLEEYGDFRRRILAMYNPHGHWGLGSGPVSAVPSLPEGEPSEIRVVGPDGLLEPRQAWSRQTSVTLALETLTERLRRTPLLSLREEFLLLWSRLIVVVQRYPRRVVEEPSPFIMRATRTTYSSEGFFEVLDEEPTDQLMPGVWQTPDGRYVRDTVWPIERQRWAREFASASEKFAQGVARMESFLNGKPQFAPSSARAGPAPVPKSFPKRTGSNVESALLRLKNLRAKLIRLPLPPEKEAMQLQLWRNNARKNGLTEQEILTVEKQAV